MFKIKEIQKTADGGVDLDIEYDEEFANQIKEVNVLPANFDPHSSYDTSFKKGCFK